MKNKSTPVVLDIECYRNYFLAAFKNIENGKVVKIDVRGLSKGLTNEQRKKLRTIMCTRTTFGYNSSKYDLPMIAGAIAGMNTDQLKEMSDRIINEDLQSWQSYKFFDLPQDSRWDHYDLQQVGPGVFTSLKLYGGRLHSQKLQDLPYDPMLELSEEQMDITDLYCVNDLDTTIDLHQSLEEDLELRRFMSEEYGIDLRSKGGAQITEAIVRKQFNTGTNKTPPPKKVTYKAPDYIKFNDDHLNELLEFVNTHRFTVDGNGYVKLPAKLTKPFLI